MATVMKQKKKIFRGSNEADHREISNESLSSSSSSITSGSIARPSTQQIWDRMYRRMLELHPELAAMPPLIYREDGQPADHFRLLEKQELLPTVDIRSSQEELTVLQDNHTKGRYQQHVFKKDHLANAAGTPRNRAETSLLSVRLPPINERSISPSGRKALRKLRKEINKY